MDLRIFSLVVVFEFKEGVNDLMDVCFEFSIELR